MFFRIVYQLGLGIVALVVLPRLGYQYWRYGKYRTSIAQRLGRDLPPILDGDGPRLWAHAVSVGETRAVLALLKAWKVANPNGQIILSSVTETGYAEGKRSAPFVDRHVYMPLDFVPVVRKVLCHFHPSEVILSEGDIWYNFLSEAKRLGASISIVNGKMSARSAWRMGLTPGLSRHLLAPVDLFCVQSETYRKRFLSLGVDSDKLHVIGNLKYDQSIDPSADFDAWRTRLGLRKDDWVITLGSTHAPEEQDLLMALLPLMGRYPRLKILLVPRHPERFDEVAQVLHEQWPGLQLARLSQGSVPEEARLVLVDAMGVLRRCYAVSRLAIVAGSFSSRIGGHNILEPIHEGVPVVFGPHMHAQQDLSDLLLERGAAWQLDEQSLASSVQELVDDPSLLELKHSAGQNLLQTLVGTTKATLEKLDVLKAQKLNVS